VAKKRVRIDGIPNRIDTVGIELEGGWDKLPKGVKLLRDGSLVFPRPKLPPGIGFDDGNNRYVNMRTMEPVDLPADVGMAYPKVGIGEIPLGPFAVITDELERAIMKYYPHHVNETCGLHVHMGLVNRLNYQRLMTPRFTMEMVVRLLDWAGTERLAKDHPIWDRLTRKNHDHCAHQYCGDEQVKIEKKDFHSRGKPHNRYTALNYCFAQHRTVECRLLPMMETPEQATRAVRTVLSITNQFLSKMREREPRKLAQVALGAAEINHYQERI